jgi:hypothetical protein
MFRADVPEASIHKDSDALRWKYDIDLAPPPGQWTPVLLKS